MSTEDPGRLASPLTEQLGPLPEPAAWAYDLARFPEGDARGRQWMPTVTRCNPGMPWMVLNLRPLYDQSAIDAAVAAQRERLKQAIYARRVTPASTRDHAFNAGIDAAWSAVAGGPF